MVLLLDSLDVFFVDRYVKKSVRTIPVLQLIDHHCNRIPGS